MKKKYTHKLTIMVILAISIGCSTTALAQDKKQITGTVSDDTGPLLGASILIKNTSQGTTTDEDGRFALMAKSSDTLVFTYLGLLPQEIPVNLETRIDVILNTDETALDQVTINAGYYSTSEKERTGNIVKVVATDLEKQNSSNPLASIQGKVSGVSIKQTSGVPGGAFDIEIRGRNSIRQDGGLPLFVIDGVPYNTATMGDHSLSSALFSSRQSPLNYINPADIESIEILKDADATAIFGSRGANGVVLITTKKRMRGKTKLEIQSFSGISKVTRSMKMMNTEQYLKMRDQAFLSDGITEIPFYEYDVNGTWSRDKYTNWVKELMGGTAHHNNIHTRVSGGNESTSYALSGTYGRETTVFPGNDYYDRLTVQSQIHHNSKDERLSLDITTNYSLIENNMQANDLTAQAYRLPPNAPALYDDEGNLNWEEGTFENPLALNASRYDNTSTNLISNAMLSYKIRNNLDIKTNMGYSQTHLKEFRTYPAAMYNPAYGVTSANAMLKNNKAERNSWIVEPQIHWQKKINNHRIQAFAGTSFQSERNEQQSFIGMGFPSDALINNLGAATNIQVDQDMASQYRYHALFGRINYTFNKKYILNLTGRRDGSSRFGPKNRFANFGAVGAAWIFSDEKIFEMESWLNYGKLRGSYGLTGNDQIGDYQFLDTYTLSGNTYNGMSGLFPSRLFNPSFGWETNKKLEVALELGLFNNRISLNPTWYLNKSSSQLVGTPLPVTTGFQTIQANLDATVQNTGFELDVHTINIKKNDFSWTTSANFTVPKNKLLRFKDLDKSTYKNRYVIGQSLDILKVYNFIGIDPESGVFQFEDYNNDGQITAADKEYIADISKKWFGGFSNNLNYKNWELNIHFQYVKQKGLNYKAFTGLPGAMINMPIYVEDNWSNNGIHADYQVLTAGENYEAIGAYSNFIDSNATISDASFIRLKNLEIAYNLPASSTKNFSGTLFFQGQNLLTLTKYQGLDPETRLKNYLPPLTQFFIGFKITI